MSQVDEFWRNFAEFCRIYANWYESSKSRSSILLFDQFFLRSSKADEMDISL